MKKNRISLIGLIISVVLSCSMLSACSGMDSPNKNFFYPDMISEAETPNANEYNEITESPFVLTENTNTSTFALGVNTAAYSQIRRAINNGLTIEKNSVRIEEMLNYFKFDYPTPTAEETLKASGYISECPWNSTNKLLTIGVKSKDVEKSEIRNNLVFLLDVSGSMASADKLPLMQTALTMLTENLNNDDVISVVTYAGSNKTLLDGARGIEKTTISAVISDLTASGSTAGAGGITRAYELAQKYFIEGGNNRVILATDGDFNVGLSSQKELEDLITEKRESGVYLSIFGFGYGNLKDNKMETLANCGNGNYAYIDSRAEAERALVESINGTLFTVARDVKTQVNFDKQKVKSFRLIGYENRQLTNEDWENSKKDAGEIGAGLCATAVYEIELFPQAQGEYLSLDIRFKNPDTSNDTQYQITEKIGESNIVSTSTRDLVFIGCIIESGLIMRDSQYKGNASITNVVFRLQKLNLTDKDSPSYDEYKEDFLELMIKYKSQLRK